MLCILLFRCHRYFRRAGLLRRSLWFGRAGEQTDIDVSLDDCVDNAADLTMDFSAHHTIDAHASRRLMRRDSRGHIERSLINDLLTQKQNLRQNEHDDEDRDNRAAAKAVADTGNRGVGGHLADEDTGDGHHKARGDDRRGRTCSSFR